MQTPLNADGEDLVKVGHRLSLTDTHCVTPIRRHYPAEDLAQLPAALELRTAVNGKIVISLAKSAVDDTELRVETTFTQLVNSINKEMAAEFESKLEAKLKHRDENLACLSRAHGVRQVEDWAINRMKAALGIPDNDKPTPCCCGGEIYCRIQVWRRYKS
jgi:hypothetical protein